MEEKHRGGFSAAGDSARSFEYALGHACVFAPLICGDICKRTMSKFENRKTQLNA